MLNDLGGEISKAYNDFQKDGRIKSIWEELEGLGEVGTFLIMNKYNYIIIYNNKIQFI